MNTQLDPSPVPPVPDAARPPAKSNSCLIGCLLAVAITVALVMVLGVIVGTNLRAFGGGALATVFSQAVRESQLPEDQKKQLIADIQWVFGEFKAGRIEFETIAQIIQALEQSGLAEVAALASLIEDANQSRLSPAEKDNVIRQTQRVVRGIVEGKISRSDAQTLADGLRRPTDQQVMKTRLGDTELKSKAAQLKRAADSAGVPDEPYEVNLAAEVHKIVQQKMDEAKAAKPPADEKQESKVE